jgi:1-acyl-sn-glycerol-3-phosphate acyltransferase
LLLDAAPHLLGSGAVRFLRSLRAWAVIAVSTIVCGLPAIPMGFVPPRGSWSMRFGRAWSRMILGGTGVRVRVLHAERLGGGSVIFAPNHESFYDILVVFRILPMRISFLAKRNLFRIPILGWSMAAAGFVPVDRGEHRRGTATVDAALRRLGRGASLIVFPEETRTRTGELLPFKAGAALLAIRSGLPLQPLGIAGTFGIQRRGGFTITPSEVVVSIGEPIPVEGLASRDRNALTETLRERVAALREEARAALTYNFDRS